jgi:isochorismate pyruvate lyase
MGEPKFLSLDEIRTNIDEIDREIVTLLSKRGNCVKQAARFKTTPDHIRDAKRLEQIIEKVTLYAKDIDFDPFTVETIYRNMLEAFIQLEMKSYADLRGSDITD